MQYRFHLRLSSYHLKNKPEDEEPWESLPPFFKAIRWIDSKRKRKDNPAKKDQDGDI
jgi:hypothetical protein